MANFAVQEARQELGFTPSMGVRANIDTRTGEGAVGAAIGQGIVSIVDKLSEVRDKHKIIESKTQLSDSSLSAADATNAYFAELKTNNDPETYNEEMNKFFSKLNDLAPKNTVAAALYNKQLATRKLSIGTKTREAAEEKIESKAKAADFLLLQKAKETGDFTLYKSSIITGVKLDVYTAEQGESLLDDADVETKKAQKNAVLAGAFLARDEDGVLDTKAADAVIDGSDLEENDRTDLKNQVENRSNQEQKRRDEAFADRTGEEDARLSTLLNDGELIEQEIDEVDLGAVGRQKTTEKNWKANWKKDLRAINKLSEPVSSVESVYDELVLGSEAVERGAMSPALWETEFRLAWANGDLSKEDRRGLRSKDIVSTKTMQNRSFSAQTDSASEARFRLVEATEDQLAQYVSTRTLQIADKNFKAAEALTKVIQKGQIQRWNMGVYKRTLREQISQNPEWSQAQIFAASDILANEFDKEFSVLVKEFDAANPRQSITKTAPDEAFNDIWNNLSLDDRALIWGERLAGTTVEELLGSDEVIEAQ